MSEMVQNSLHVAIETLEMSQGLLDNSMKSRLSNLCEKTNQQPSPTPIQKFHPSELDTLFTLVKSLQAKIVTDQGELMAKTTTRDIASLTGSISALLRAFGSLQEKVDHAKEQSQLEYAVIEALKDLPKEARHAFFDRMDEASDFLQQVEDAHDYWAGFKAG